MRCASGRSFKAGETLAVLGASGGAGLAAVELGKLMGARVIACASSDEKLAFARAHGADETINYASGKSARCTANSTAANTASTWSMIRSAAHTRNRRCVRSPGRAVTSWSDFTAGEIPKTPRQSGAARKLRYSRRILGFVEQARAAGQHALLGDVARWAADGKLSAHIHAAFPLADIAAAMKLISDRKVMGKDRAAAVSAASCEQHQPARSRANARRAASPCSGLM